jgi:DNA topoisomerase-1
VDIDTAIQLIEQKRKEVSKSIIKTFKDHPEVTILKGRYGPYIKFGNKNLKIPRGKDPEELTYDDCVEISNKTTVKKRKYTKK